jgi:hypothetical protein
VNRLRRPGWLWLGAWLAVGVWAEPSAPAAPDAVARRAIAALQREDLDAVRALVAPDALPLIERKALVVLGHAIARYKDAPVVLVHHADTQSSEGQPQEQWVYQLRGRDESILMLFKLRDVAGHPRIAHIEWQPAPLDLRERFPFSLAGVPPFFYLVLLAACGVPLLMLYALLLCLWRRPRAWGLWCVCIALGLGRLSLIWLPTPYDASYLEFEPIALQPLGTKLEKDPAYDPWRLSVSLPLGALAYLWTQRRARADRGRPVA